MLDALFKPRAVAVIGASNNPLSIGYIVVENLLKNALDSVDKQRGVITVEVRRDPQAEAVDVRIADNGRGMTPEQRRRIFEPGFTTKRRGWGLGLSLARRIVEEYHGGRMTIVKSQRDKGTVFALTIPVS